MEGQSLWEYLCLQDTMISNLGTHMWLALELVTWSVLSRWNLEKTLTSQEMNMLCPDFPQTLLVPASLLVKLPETPNASHCFCLSHLCISDTLSINITIKLISSNHFQKNSLTLNLDHGPYFCNSIVAHLHHNIYHTVL